MWSANFRLVRRALPGIVSGTNPGSVVQRLKFFSSAIRHRKQLASITQTSSPALRQVLDERPASVVGTLVWPYICASWDVSRRIEQLEQHYKIVDGLAPIFHFSVNDHLQLLDLSDVHKGLHVVLDRPQWFIREGGFTLNLFIDDFRAYSLAFSFSKGPNGSIDCLIGSLQGRATDDAQDHYRDLTKATHGLRPRDLLIEVCRMLSRHLEVQRLLAVQNNQRHHLHKYFGGKKPGPQNYDVIWQDRGGVPEDNFFYRLPLDPGQRSINEIKANKRSLYRRRYIFLDRIERELSENISGVERIAIAAE